MVQIDESKVGKRKYHWGHRVTRQWVFDGIKEDARRCFLVAVEDRSEATPLPIIKDWIVLGMLIVSDCSKSYHILVKHGYSHKLWTIQRSLLMKMDNYTQCNTNIMEGHWQQMKISFSVFSTRKASYSFYLGEFIWRHANTSWNWLTSHWVIWVILLWIEWRAAEPLEWYFFKSGPSWESVWGMPVSRN